MGIKRETARKHMAEGVALLTVSPWWRPPLDGFHLWLCCSFALCPFSFSLVLDLFRRKCCLHHLGGRNSLLQYGKKIFEIAVVPKFDYLSGRIWALDALRFDVGAWRRGRGKWPIVLIEQSKKDVFESAGVSVWMVFRSDLVFFHPLQHLCPGRPLGDSRKIKQRYTTTNSSVVSKSHRLGPSLCFQRNENREIISIRG